MSRIQFRDLDTSSDEEEAGSVIISKHEMRTRLGWCNPIGVLQVKQELEKTDTAEDVTKRQKIVQTQDQPLQDIQEREAEDEAEWDDTHETEEEIDDNSDEINDEQKEIKEENDHIESKESSLTPKLEQLWQLESRDQ